MPRTASIHNNEIRGRKSLSLRSVLEFHPKETDIIPEAFDRSAVHPQFDVERLEGVRIVVGVQRLKWGRHIKVTDRAPSRRSAKIGLVEMTEIIADANA